MKGPHVMTVATHAKQVLSILHTYYLDGRFTDVTVTTMDGVELSAHRVVLTSNSPFLQKILREDMQNLTIDADFPSMKTVLEFMYTGSLGLTNENILAIATLADVLHMVKLRQLCNIFIQMASRNIDKQAGDVKHDTAILPLPKLPQISASELNGNSTGVDGMGNTNPDTTLSEPIFTENDQTSVTESISKYVCEVCSKTFAMLFSLNRHVARKHNCASLASVVTAIKVISKYRSRVKRHVYGTKKLFNKSIAIDHSKERSQIVCVHCGKHFCHQIAHNKHSVMHHPKGRQIRQATNKSSVPLSPQLSLSSPENLHEDEQGERGMEESDYASDTGTHRRRRTVSSNSPDTTYQIKTEPVASTSVTGNTGVVNAGALPSSSPSSSSQKIILKVVKVKLRGSNDGPPMTSRDRDVIVSRMSSADETTPGRPVQAATHIVTRSTIRKLIHNVPKPVTMVMVKRLQSAEKPDRSVVQNRMKQPAKKHGRPASKSVNARSKSKTIFKSKPASKSEGNGHKVPISNTSFQTEKKTWPCEVCGSKFQKKASLFQHQRIHLGTTFDCHHCGKPFTEERKLDMHVLLLHNNNMLRCRYCQKKYSSCCGLRNCLRRHGVKRKVCYRQIMDMVAQFMKLSGSNAMNSSNEVSSQDFSVVSGSADSDRASSVKELDNSSNVEKPTSASGEKEPESAGEGKEFDNASGDKEPDSAGIAKKPDCVSGIKVPASVSGTRRPNTRRIVVQANEEDEDVGSMLGQNDVDPDIEISQAPLPSGVETYVANLKSELASFHFLKVKPNADGKLQCPECGSFFSTQSHMVRHRRIHKGFVYNCSACNKSYADKRELEVHYRAVHENNPLQCEFCPSTFKSRTGYDYHVRRHKGDLRNMCSICGKRFLLMSEYLPHMAKHAGVKAYTCSVCDKSFSHGSSLSLHRKHCGKAMPKLLCSECGKEFKKKQSLMLHEQRHRFDTRTQCCYCDEFLASSSMRRHIRRKHKNIRLKSPRMDDVWKHQSTL